MNKNITNIFLFIFSISVIFSCKNDSNQAEEVSENSEEIIAKSTFEETGDSRYNDSMRMVAKYNKSQQNVDGDFISKKLDGKTTSTSNKTSGDNIPSICNLLQKNFIAKEFGISEKEIMVSNGTRREGISSGSESCFWRWPGGGFLIKISKNPLPGELENWPEVYMNSKKSQGERSISNGETVTYQFEDFEGPGIKNLYNHELGRYYSSYQDKFIVTLIYNLNLPKRQQNKISKNVLQNVFSNLN